MRSMPVSATGMLWFRNAAQYAEYLVLFEDSHVLPRSFSSWQRKATNGYEGLLRQGHVVVKVHAAPEEFQAWCAANGHRLNAAGRIAFAAFKAFEKVRGQHPTQSDD